MSPSSRQGTCSGTRYGRRGSRCSPPVAKDPKYDFTIAHRLLWSRRDEILKLFRSFLASPASATAEPPELERELRGMAMKQDAEES